MIAPRWLLGLSLAAGAGAQCDALELTRNVPKQNDYLGNSVRLQGGQVFAGAYGANNPPNSGQVFLFDVASGDVEGSLNGATSGDLMGMHLDVDGDFVIAGAYWGGSAGQAYLFHHPTETLVHVFEPSDGTVEDRFGRHVAIDGDYVVVGNWWDADLFPQGGSVYVFDRITGQELYKLVPPNGMVNHDFGWGLALEGTTLAVGAMGGDDVYVYDVTNGQLQLQLEPPDALGNGEFGFDLDLEGGRLIVGAPGAGGGRAFVFDAATGVLLADLHPDGLTTGDEFGVAVAIHGNLAAVGAEEQDDRGAAYVFDLTTGAQLARILDRTGHDGAEFGGSVDMDDQWLVIGDRYKDVGVYRGGMVYRTRLADLQGVAYCSAQPNSTGGPATITASGCSDLADDHLSLSVRGLPGSEFGYFLTSATQDFVQAPGGSQGDLCLGGTIGRFSSQVGQSSPGGSFAIQVDLTALPLQPPHAVQPGETWNFQLWYRDVNPGPTSNFSDATSVTF